MDPLLPQPTEGRPSSFRRLGIALLLLALLAAAAGGVYAWQRHRLAPAPPPPPPAAVEEVPNARPGVAFVGSQRCAECHADIAASYAAHPMGQSVSPARAELSAQRHAASVFQVAPLRYEVERRADKVIHREALATDPAAAAVAAEIDWTIGSGRQGQSFLVNRQGRLYQSPISWYVGAKKWNLSPGFAQRNQHFGRTITELCLLCHSNAVQVEKGSINHFVPEPLRLEPIGCERCHGPGELHVAAHRGSAAGGGADRTIVNPRRLSPARREEVCAQCHLQGEARIPRAGKAVADYRPGLRLEDFVSVFVRPPGDGANRKAVSHVEQMRLSRCFQASSGQMGCISCHDPHVFPAEAKRVAWYRGRCLKCHAEDSCTLPAPQRRQRSSEDSCIDCHMPRGDSSNIAHTSITDHRIVRRPEPPAAEDAAEELFLIPFQTGAFDPSDVGLRRDLGLALTELAEGIASEAQRRQLAHQVVGVLGPILERDSEDVAALEGLGQALWRDKHPREALTVLDKALQQAPRRELALSTAALIALEMRDTERGLGYWRRLLALNPYTWQTHSYYAQTLALRERWAEAVQSCRQALRLNPFEPRTRMLLIDCLIRQGEKQAARDEFAVLLALKSDEPAPLRKWFEELMGR